MSSPSWQGHRTGSRWSPVRTLAVAPLRGDLGFCPNSRGNKAAANQKKKKKKVSSGSACRPAYCTDNLNRRKLHPPFVHFVHMCSNPGYLWRPCSVTWDVPNQNRRHYRTPARAHACSRDRFHCIDLLSLEILRGRNIFRWRNIFAPFLLERPSEQTPGRPKL